MDQLLMGLYGSVDELKLDNEKFSVSSGHNQTSGDTRSVQADAVSNNSCSGSLVSQEVDSMHSHGVYSTLSSEDYDFGDRVLSYITQMLMEEDMQEKNCMYQESSSSLQATEKSLYELIHDTSTTKTYATTANYEPQDMNNRKCLNGASKSTSYDESCSLEFRASCGGDGSLDSPISTLEVPENFIGVESIMQFNKGFEEASKFLPNTSGLFVDLEAKNVTVDSDKLENETRPLDGYRGKKNPHPHDVNFDCERSNKQPAVCNTEPNVSSEMFDMVLLSCGKQSALCEALQHGTQKNVKQNVNSKRSNGGKTRGKKNGGKRNAADLRTLLTMCAQAVSAGDRRGATDLLKQIRQNSSLIGDGMQRMACYFADGLEARLAGSGTQVYKSLISKPTSAAVVLKAYHLLLAACPFKKLSNFFSNKTIMNIAEKAKKLHIIDFGILYGFQWPCLIERLSSRPGGPPELQITGIDFPHPGFRPAERVEETGRRLAGYAKTFNVPFKFNAIAQKWDTVKLEDLKIGEDEVLVVNCIHRLRNVVDETVIVDSPRNIVLNLIRKMNPDVFILGTVNGAYNAPFFITRFREALFHFSTLFDTLETIVPRESPERMSIEKEIFGREAMNVIACEGAERIERPETYKQWQVRNLRAGFTQLPLNREIVKIAKEKVNSLYHKDFVIDEDSEWLLQGWKGRLVFGLSCWKPAC